MSVKLRIIYIVFAVMCLAVSCSTPAGKAGGAAAPLRDAYKESILPNAVRARVAVEAAADFGWGKYVGLDGATVTMKGFGASAPAAKLFEKFGFTKENVVKTMKSVLAK